MGYRERGSDNPINWSFRAGRLFGIDIRVHIAFIICAVVMVWMELPEKGATETVSIGRVIVDALGTYGLLFLIVLLHEFGHCFGARRMGGEADEILIWPLGGLAQVNPPHEARAHMITTLAGPMVNVVLCAICSVVLTLWFGTLGAVPWNPLHPTIPVDETVFFRASTAQIWVMRFYGLSYFLLLVNMLPIFPFDGGRVVQAWLWPRKGYHDSMMIATFTGMVGAVLIGLVGLFIEESWILMMIAVFGYFTCWQTRRMIRETGETEGQFGYDFSQGYTSLDGESAPEKKPGFWERRRERKKKLRADWERLQAEKHELAVERVLRKVSDSGLDSLTPGERKVLEEETARHRVSDSQTEETGSQ